ncbi:MAG: SRPBCC family protein [Actinobacteria bacterium]|nr:SRPBCC family protein [Actinomycetota bacterium]
MEITNEFTLSLPPEDAYRLLLDLEKVTPCMPGAELGEATEDGGRRVKVTVKLGPLRFVYDGTVRIAEQDDAERRAVLVGAAREMKGQGNAEATITMTVRPEGDLSSVLTVADVNLTGRAAQSGRGIVEDVSKRMIGRMTAELEARYAAPTAAGDAPTASADGAAPAGSGAAPPAAEAQPLRAGSLILPMIWDRIKVLFTRRRSRAERAR